MNNRIDQRFLQLRQERTSGFMAYITGGDPTPEKTVDIASGFIRGWSRLSGDRDSIFRPFGRRSCKSTRRAAGFGSRHDRSRNC